MSLNSRPASLKSTGEPSAEPSEWPSGHYPDVMDPSKVLLRRAAEPPNPVLPKQKASKQLPKTMRERMPLSSSLTGAGRAGKVGCLCGSTGSKYTGAVLAGRPHGKGQYFAPSVKPGGPLRLMYEGDFNRGARDGQGACYYHSGEVYVGSWVHNKRTGLGRLTYVDGSIYDGMWRNDKRHGVGTFYSTSGDIFVGTFCDDRRHGMGTTYMPTRGKKYVAEYVNDNPTCGSFFDLDNEDVEAPTTQQLRGTIAAGTIRQQMGPQQLPGQLPKLQLSQPSKILAKEFVAVRQQRQQQKSPALGYTLPADSMNLLRHAFILMAGGDDCSAFVLPHQLQELVVLAGLDPAAPPVVKLMGVLQGRAGSRAATNGDARLYLEEFLGVVCFFREQALDVLQHEQVQKAAADAAARAAAANAEADADAPRAADAPTLNTVAAAVDSASARQQHVDQEQEEQWQVDEDDSTSLLGSANGEEGTHQAAGSSAEAAIEEHATPEGSAWGAGNDELMLERHIAQHRGDSAAGGAVVSEPAEAATAKEATASWEVVAPEAGLTEAPEGSNAADNAAEQALACGAGLQGIEAAVQEDHAPGQQLIEQVDTANPAWNTSTSNHEAADSILAANSPIIIESTNHETAEMEDTTSS